MAGGENSLIALGSACLPVTDRLQPDSPPKSRHIMGVRYVMSGRHPSRLRSTFVRKFEIRFYQ